MMYFNEGIMGQGTTFFASKLKQNKEVSTVTYILDIAEAGAGMLAASGLIYSNINIPMGLIGELPSAFLGMLLLGYSLSMLVPQNLSAQPNANNNSLRPGV